MRKLRNINSAKFHGLFLLPTYTRLLTLCQAFLPILGLSQWLSWYSLPANAEDAGFIPGSEKIPWRRKWQPTLIFLPGKSHGQTSLGDYRAHGVAKGQVRLTTHTHKLFPSCCSLSSACYFSGCPDKPCEPTQLVLCAFAEHFSFWAMVYLALISYWQLLSLC